MQLPLRWQLLLWLGGALVVLLVPLAVLTVGEAQRAAVSELERATLARLSFMLATGPPQIIDLAEAVQEFGGGVGFRIDGSANITFTDTGQHALPGELISIVSQGEVFRKVEGHTLWIALPGDRGGVGLGISLNEVANLPLRLLGLYLGLGSVLLVLAWGLGAWGLVHSLQPLSQLAQQIANRSPHNLSALPRPRLPEMAPAMDSLNRLMGELARTLEQMKQQEGSSKRFAYGASHELRNPLAALRGFLEVLQRHPGQTRALEGALHQTERMERILGTLLELARLEGSAQVSRQWVDLALLLPPAVQRNPREDWPAVWANPELLQLALANLLRNAQVHGLPPITAQLEATPTGHWLWISDCGKGFAPDLRERAFEPFVKQGDGTGLGLAIVAAVARVHGGQTRIEQGSQATRVGLWLPFSQS
jgi:two-component system sensor histidine kinase TctE